MKSKSFVLFLSILLLFLLIGTESSSSSLTGGIRNFKFRKKDPNISNPNKKMELRRYHDDSGNLLAFGYRLPEKSYAIFRLPPPGSSAQPAHAQQRRGGQRPSLSGGGNLENLNNNLNRARKQISIPPLVNNFGSSANFRRDKKAILNSNFVKEDNYSDDEKVKLDNSTTVIQYKLTRANKFNNEETNDKGTGIMDNIPTKSYSETLTGSTFLPTAIPTVFEAVPSSTSTITGAISSDFQPTSQSFSEHVNNNTYDEESSSIDLNRNNANTIQSNYDFSYPVVEVSLNLTNKQTSVPNLQNNDKTKEEDLYNTFENVSIFEAFPTTETFESTKTSVNGPSVEEDDHDSDWSIPILEPTRISEISTVQEDEFLSYDPTFEPFRSNSDKNDYQSNSDLFNPFQSNLDKKGSFKKLSSINNDEKETNPIFKTFPRSNYDKNGYLEKDLTSSEMTEIEESDLVQLEDESEDPTQISISEVTSQFILGKKELEETTDSPIGAYEDFRIKESTLRIDDNLPKSTAIIPEALTQRNEGINDDPDLFEDENSEEEFEFQSKFEDESGRDSSDELDESGQSKCRQTPNLNLLQSVFPTCLNFLNNTNCHNTSSDLSLFGVCLVKSYPETRALTLSQTLTSGGGTVQFDSDDDCTEFVHLFFPNCSDHIPSCSMVQNNQEQAVLVLGCLFSHYTELMIPLLTVGKEP